MTKGKTDAFNEALAKATRLRTSEMLRAKRDAYEKESTATLRSYDRMIKLAEEAEQVLIDAGNLL